MTFIKAYDMTQGSDWKWAYAQQYTNDSLAKLHINDDDIAYARMKVAAANIDCRNIGGGDENDKWCKWASEDNQTLDRMLNAQITPAEAAAQKGIFQKLWDSIKKIFGL